MSILGIVVLLGLICMVISSGLMFIIGSIAQGAPGAVAIISVIVTWMVMAALSAMNSVISAVGYYELRMEKEGVGIEDIVAVFD